MAIEIALIEFSGVAGIVGLFYPEGEAKGKGLATGDYSPITLTSTLFFRCPSNSP